MHTTFRVLVYILMNLEGKEVGGPARMIPTPMDLYNASYNIQTSRSCFEPGLLLILFCPIANL